MVIIVVLGKVYNRNLRQDQSIGQPILTSPAVSPTQVLPNLMSQCFFNNRIYQPDETFVIQRSAGCSLCKCQADGVARCKEAECPN